VGERRTERGAAALWPQRRCARVPAAPGPWPAGGRCLCGGPAGRRAPGRKWPPPQAARLRRGGGLGFIGAPALAHLLAPFFRHVLSSGDPGGPRAQGDGGPQQASATRAGTWCPSIAPRQQTSPPDRTA
jgi:hypothetical protein